MRIHCILGNSFEAALLLCRHFWGRSSPVIAHKWLQTKKGISSLAEQSFSMCNICIHCILFKQWCSPLQCQNPYWIRIIYMTCIYRATANNQLIINHKNRKILFCMDPDPCPSLPSTTFALPVLSLLSCLLSWGKPDRLVCGTVARTAFLQHTQINWGLALTMLISDHVS